MSYSFASEPRLVRSKYRNEDEISRMSASLNLMNDPRVVRGSNYSPAKDASSLSASLPSGIVKPGKSKTRPLKSTKKSIFDIRPDQRPHIEVSLDEFLIEASSPVPEVEISTQTDRFKGLPPPKPYVPKKTGVDASTQIEASDDLFDFDISVEPLLKVLVGKTMEQALMEVEEEAEITALRAAKADFVRDEQKESVAVREMEKLEVERWNLKADALRNAKEDYERRVTLSFKVASRSFSASMVADALISAMKSLSRDRDDPVAARFLPENDPRRLAVAREFMPALYADVEARAAASRIARAAVDDVLGRTMEKARDALREAKHPTIKEKKEIKPPDGFIHVFLPGLAVGVAVDAVGPILVPHCEPVLNVVQVLVAWLVEKIPDFVLPEDGWLRLAHLGEELDHERSLRDLGVQDSTTLEMIVS